MHMNEKVDTIDIRGLQMTIVLLVLVDVVDVLDDGDEHIHTHSASCGVSEEHCVCVNDGVYACSRTCDGNRCCNSKRLRFAAPSGSAPTPHSESRRDVAPNGVVAPEPPVHHRSEL
ncbi:unnamed protein product [Strongylus vulgaris]|uniref:Uncharacterized protein n=1 Tax=Strongylus vulgaris TaxID=40348 RepID=A0A3P7IFS3_STRVU|nr:unnamed protein product [Strongylus vulgaris]